LTYSFVQEDAPKNQSADMDTSGEQATSAVAQLSIQQQS
jgi:hypothetical protein